MEAATALTAPPVATQMLVLAGAGSGPPAEGAAGAEQAAQRARAGQAAGAAAAAATSAPGRQQIATGNQAGQQQDGGGRRPMGQPGVAGLVLCPRALSTTCRLSRLWQRTATMLGAPTTSVPRVTTTASSSPGLTNTRVVVVAVAAVVEVVVQGVVGAGGAQVLLLQEAPGLWAALVRTTGTRASSVASLATGPAAAPTARLHRQWAIRQHHQQLVLLVHAMLMPDGCGIAMVCLRPVVVGLRRLAHACM